MAAGTSYLTIDKIANDGTLELADASSGAVVKLADATGSTDSFNIVTKVDAIGLTFGTVHKVAGVETLKLNAVDTTRHIGCCTYQHRLPDREGRQGHQPDDRRQLQRHPDAGRCDQQAQYSSTLRR